MIKSISEQLLVPPDPDDAGLLQQAESLDVEDVDDGDLGDPELLPGSVADGDPLGHVEVRPDNYCRVMKGILC